MNLLFKRSLQICAAMAVLSTTACVIDPYYSGVNYDDTGTTVYPINTVSTQTVYTNSAAAVTTGFLIGNAYYWNDRYYPVSYYTNNNRRYYRPDFNRPSMYHPNARYRHLNAAQINHWKHNQASSFDPRYRPTPSHIQRPNPNRPNNVRPQPNRPGAQQPNRPNQPQVNQNRPNMNQQRPQVNQNVRPNTPRFGPNLNAAQRQEIMRQTQQNRQQQLQQNRQARGFQNRRMNER